MTQKLTPKNAGSILKKIRKEKRVSREKLSRISNTGADMIFRFETGLNGITVSRFIQLVNDLGMDIIISKKDQ